MCVGVFASVCLCVCEWRCACVSLCVLSAYVLGVGVIILRY